MQKRNTKANRLPLTAFNLFPTICFATNAAISVVCSFSCYRRYYCCWRWPEFTGCCCVAAVDYLKQQKPIASGNSGAGEFNGYNLGKPAIIQRNLYIMDINCSVRALNKNYLLADTDIILTYFSLLIAFLNLMWYKISSVNFIDILLQLKINIPPLIKSARTVRLRLTAAYRFHVLK